MTSATRSTCTLLSLMSCSQLGLVHADADVTCPQLQTRYGWCFIPYLGWREDSELTEF